MASSALHKPTGKIWLAEDLSLNRESVRSNDFFCTDCFIPLFPAAYHEVNKVRPYFTPGKSNQHRIECLVPQYDRYVELAKKQSIKTEMGFPFAYPSVLELSGERPATQLEKLATVSEVTSGLGKDSGNPTQGLKFHNCTTRNIRSIVKQFLDFPNDRDLPLRINGVEAKTYIGVFRYLKANDSQNYIGKKYIFIGSVLGKELVKPTQIEIHLKRGKDESGNKFLSPYQVNIKTENWPKSEISNLLSEIGIAREVSNKTKGEAWDKRLKPYLFFFGESYSNDPLSFTVEDYRLICCKPCGTLFSK